MSFLKFSAQLLVAVAMFLITPTLMTNASADEITEEDGKFFTSDDTPIYNIQEDGTVDWYTYSGFRRYHSECHVCHGPEAAGSTFAPALMESLKTISYEDFLSIVASGRERVTADGSVSKMPALGDNFNVICYIDDLYVYIKARSDGVLPPGRPGKRAAKPQTAKDDEEACRS